MGSGKRVKGTDIQVSLLSWCALFPVGSSPHGSMASGTQLLQEKGEDSWWEQS